MKKTTPRPVSQDSQTPKYSEHGPVWRVVPMEDLPEMATETVTIWLVVDLDYNERDHTGYEMARCAKKEDAEFLARACNEHAALVAALKCLTDWANLNVSDPAATIPINQARAALESAKAAR